MSTATQTVEIIPFDDEPFRIEFFPQRLTTDQLEILRRGIDEWTRKGAWAHRIVSWMKRVATDEKVRRSRNAIAAAASATVKRDGDAGSAPPEECTRPALRMLEWSDREVSEALIASVSILRGSWDKELSAFFLAVNVLVSMECARRLRARAPNK